MKTYLKPVCLCLLLAIGGCADVPTVVPVHENGFCHPSQDLPAHKTMKKVPEQTTLLEDLYGLLALERKDHAGDIRDYNSLYEQCVGKIKPASTS